MASIALLDGYSRLNKSCKMLASQNHSNPGLQRNDGYMPTAYPHSHLQILNLIGKRMVRSSDNKHRAEITAKYSTTTTDQCTTPYSLDINHMSHMCLEQHPIFYV